MPIIDSILLTKLKQVESIQYFFAFINLKPSRSKIYTFTQSFVSLIFQLYLQVAYNQ